MSGDDSDPKILVVGGGFAGLKAAIFLQQALGDQATTRLISPEDRFAIKPRYIRPGNTGGLDTIALTDLKRATGIAWIQDSVRAVDFQQRLAHGVKGSLAYDYLILAMGSGFSPESVPGLPEHGWPYWQGRSEDAWETKLLDRVRSQPGALTRVLFALCEGNYCPDPIYNLIGRSDALLREHGIRDRAELMLATYETFACQAFAAADGRRAAERLLPSLDRLYRRFCATQVSANDVSDRFGNRLPYDLLVAAPPQIPALLLPQLPRDAGGFVIVQSDTRQVPGFADVYVVGDLAAAGPKQAYHAVRQAEIAGAHIAARVRGQPLPRVSFQARELCREIENSGGFPNVAHWWN